MHAGNRLVVDPGILQAALEVSVDPNPLHFPAARNLVFPDHRNIVLGLARHHAGIASDATIQIDGHAPGVAVVRVGRIDGRPVFLAFLAGHGRVLAEFLQRRPTHQLALQRRHALLFALFAFLAHDVVVLRRDQLVSLPGLLYLRAANPGVFRGREQVGIKTDARAHMAGPAPSVAQVQGEGIIGLAGRNPDGRLHPLPVRAQLHHIAVRHAQLVGARGADQSGVVPSQLGEGLGQFLQPTIVREAAIPNRGIRAQDDFDSACTRFCRRGGDAPG